MDTIGIMPAPGIVLADKKCGVDPVLSATRYGYNVFWSGFYVARESDFNSLQDLNGVIWSYFNVSSQTSYLTPKTIFDELGITLDQSFPAGDHRAAIRAVYVGEADIGTSIYSPPLFPSGRWTREMSPDIPDAFLDECGKSQNNKLICGEYQIIDARAFLLDEFPDVAQKIRILDISREFPHDTIAYSSDFPESLKTIITDALDSYLNSSACLETICNENFFAWEGADLIKDENFDMVRRFVEAQGITIDNIE